MSFDVFDTTLTRLTGSPVSVFLLLGRRLNRASRVHCSPLSFVQARMEAERRASSNHFGQDVNIKQIYWELGTTFGWTESECLEIAEHECEVEKALIRSIPCTKERVDKARADGYRIAFLSDMYLPADFIRCELSRYGYLKKGDICLISCEGGKGKRDGRLFRSLIDDHNLQARAITHLGDNFAADVAMPRRMGIRSAHFSGAALNRFENILEAHATTTEGLSSLMAGASRLARLHTSVPSDHARALRDVAAGVMSPTLVGYVLWILRRAQRRQLKRLYFVSRDGQILKLIAEALISKLGLDIECRYLYGSRQAWHLPALEAFSEREFAWILARSEYMSVRGILSRVGMSPEDFSDELRLLGFEQDDYNRKLSEAEKDRLRPLFARRQFQQGVLEQSRRKRDVFLQYLKQEEVIGSVPAGIVEIGWHGRMQDSLDAVLTAVGHEPIPFFYFGLIGDAGEGVCGLRESYLFDGRRTTGYLRAVPQVWAIMETFCAADHGMTTEFIRENGSIRPALKEECNSKVIDWGLPIVRQSVSTFLENLLLDPELVDWQADVREATIKILRAFWLEPTRAEAFAWGNFPYEDDQSGERWYPLAEPYRVGDVFEAFWLGRAPNRDRASAWVEGSVLKTSPSLRMAIRVARRLGSRLKAAYRLERARRLYSRGLETARHAN